MQKHPCLKAYTFLALDDFKHNHALLYREKREVLATRHSVSWVELHSQQVLVYVVYADSSSSFTTMIRTQ